MCIHAYMNMTIYVGSQKECIDMFIYVGRHVLCVCLPVSMYACMHVGRPASIYYVCK